MLPSHIIYLFLVKIKTVHFIFKITRCSLGRKAPRGGFSHFSLGDSLGRTGRKARLICGRVVLNGCRQKGTWLCASNPVSPPCVGIQRGSRIGFRDAIKACCPCLEGGTEWLVLPEMGDLHPNQEPEQCLLSKGQMGQAVGLRTFNFFF